MVNNFKTFVLLAVLAALVLGVSSAYGGSHGRNLGLVLVVGMGLVSYWFSDKIALAMSRAQEVSEAESPVLFRVMRNLTQRAGLPMPRIYVTPEWAPNAFATGRDPQHASVAVTQGILDLLELDELEGVLAHELAHVKNRDILISSVAAVLAGVLTQLADMLRWATIFGGANRDEDGPSGLEMIGMMVVAPVAAGLVQMAISRSREYEADRVGARICGAPLSLANALLKLQEGVHRRPMVHTNPATAHMYITNPFEGAGRMVFRLFSTHPPTEERVRRLQEMASGRLQ